jgi:hypothetical protein
MELPLTIKPVGAQYIDQSSAMSARANSERIGPIAAQYRGQRRQASQVVRDGYYRGLLDILTVLTGGQHLHPDAPLNPLDLAVFAHPMQYLPATLRG